MVKKKKKANNNELQFQTHSSSEFENQIKTCDKIWGEIGNSTYSSNVLCTFQCLLKLSIEQIVYQVDTIVTIQKNILEIFDTEGYNLLSLSTNIERQYNNFENIQKIQKDTSCKEEILLYISYVRWSKRVFTIIHNDDISIQMAGLTLLYPLIIYLPTSLLVAINTPLVIRQLEIVESLERNTPVLNVVLALRSMVCIIYRMQNINKDMIAKYAARMAKYLLQYITRLCDELQPLINNNTIISSDDTTIVSRELLYDQLFILYDCCVTTSMVYMFRSIIIEIQVVLFRLLQFGELLPNNKTTNYDNISSTIYLVASTLFFTYSILSSKTYIQLLQKQNPNVGITYDSSSNTDINQENMDKIQNQEVLTTSSIHYSKQYTYSIYSPTSIYIYSIISTIKKLLINYLPPHILKKSSIASQQIWSDDEINKQYIHKQDTKIPNIEIHSLTSIDTKDTNILYIILLQRLQNLIYCLECIFTFSIGRYISVNIYNDTTSNILQVIPQSDILSTIKLILTLPRAIDSNISIVTDESRINLQQYTILISKLQKCSVLILQLQIDNCKPDIIPHSIDISILLKECINTSLYNHDIELFQYTLKCVQLLIQTCGAPCIYTIIIEPLLRIGLHIQYTVAYTCMQKLQEKSTPDTKEILIKVQEMCTQYLIHNITNIDKKSFSKKKIYKIKRQKLLSILPGPTYGIDNTNNIDKTEDIEEEEEELSLSSNTNSNTAIKLKKLFQDIQNFDSTDLHRKLITERLLHTILQFLISISDNPSLQLCMGNDIRHTINRMLLSVALCNIDIKGNIVIPLQSRLIHIWYECLFTFSYQYFPTIASIPQIRKVAELGSICQDAHIRHISIQVLSQLKTKSFNQPNILLSTNYDIHTLKNKYDTIDKNIVSDTIYTYTPQENLILPIISQDLISLKNSSLQREDLYGNDIDDDNDIVDDIDDDNDIVDDIDDDNNDIVSIEKNSSSELLSKDNFAYIDSVNTTDTKDLNIETTNNGSALKGSPNFYDTIKSNTSIKEFDNLTSLDTKYTNNKDIENIEKEIVREIIDSEKSTDNEDDDSYVCINDESIIDEGNDVRLWTV